MKALRVIETYRYSARRPKACGDSMSLRWPQLLGRPKSFKPASLVQRVAKRPLGTWRLSRRHDASSRPFRYVLSGTMLISIPSLILLRSEESTDRERLEQLPAEREAQRQQQSGSLPQRIWDRIVLHLIEPLSTLRRFLWLSLIFLPVILTSPILLRQALPHQQDPPSVQWWYSLLVKQMERAGPTFIKVCFSRALIP